MKNSYSMHVIAFLFAAYAASLPAFVGWDIATYNLDFNAAEPMWQKANRWRQYFADIRALGIDVPTPRMFHSTMGYLDLAYVTAIAVFWFGWAFLFFRIAYAGTFEVAAGLIWLSTLTPITAVRLKLQRWQNELIYQTNHSVWFARLLAVLFNRYASNVLLAFGIAIVLTANVSFALMLAGLTALFTAPYYELNWRKILPRELLKSPDKPRPEPLTPLFRLGWLRWLKLQLRFVLGHEPAAALRKGAAMFRAPLIRAYMYEAQSAEQRLIYDQEQDVTANTETVFQRLEYGCDLRRTLILNRYQNRLSDCHPANKLRMPVDIGALAPVGRLMFLPVAINADNGKESYDFLDFDLSDHTAQTYVYRATQRAVDLDRWSAALPSIQSYLGGRWRVIPRDGATLTLQKLPEIPAMFPLSDAALKRDHVFFGLDLNTAEPVYLPLDRFAHTLICGPTGMGKSVFLHQLMASVMFNLDRFEMVYLVDPKFGLELQGYPPLSDKFKLADTAETIAAMLDELISEMERRAADMRPRKLKEWDGPLILVVIDEFADILLAPEKKADREALATKFTRLTNLSRALGFRFWVQSQKFTADAIPTPIRNNLQSLVSFRMVSNQQASMLFGGIESFPADIRELKPGQVIFRDGLTSRMYAIQGAFVTTEDVERLAGPSQSAAANDNASDALQIT